MTMRNCCISEYDLIAFKTGEVLRAESLMVMNNGLFSLLLLALSCRLLTAV